MRGAQQTGHTEAALLDFLYVAEQRNLQNAYGSGLYHLEIYPQKILRTLYNLIPPAFSRDACYSRLGHWDPAGFGRIGRHCSHRLPWVAQYEVFLQSPGSVSLTWSTVLSFSREQYSFFDKQAFHCLSEILWFFSDILKLRCKKNNYHFTYSRDQNSNTQKEIFQNQNSALIFYSIAFLMRPNSHL